MKLLLFDIDGTLLIGRSNLYRDPLNRAGRELFHPDFSVDLLNRLGSIDAHIVEEAIILVGQTPDPDRIAAFQRNYFSYLSEAAPTATVLPGIVDLLNELEKRRDVVLGLVTGNYRESARIKLDGVGLRFDRFHVGGFGDRKTTRAELVREAMDRARARFDDPFPPGEVIVIGDTPKDVACARENGCPAVAVATGWTSSEELAQHDPDLLLDDLSCPEPFYRFVFTES